MDQILSSYVKAMQFQDLKLFRFARAKTQSVTLEFKELFPYRQF